MTISGFLDFLGFEPAPGQLSLPGSARLPVFSCFLDLDSRASFLDFGTLCFLGSTQLCPLTIVNHSLTIAHLFEDVSESVPTVLVMKPGV